MEATGSLGEAVIAPLRRYFLGLGTTSVSAHATFVILPVASVNTTILDGSVRLVRGIILYVRVLFTLKNAKNTLECGTFCKNFSNHSI